MGTYGGTPGSAFLFWGRGSCREGRAEKGGHKRWVYVRRSPEAYSRTGGGTAAVVVLASLAICGMKSNERRGDPAITTCSLDGVDLACRKRVTLR